MSVSYTHLDVYKRQVTMCTGVTIYIYCMLKLWGVFCNLEHFIPNDLIAKDNVKHKITTNTPKVSIEITKLRNLYKWQIIQ